MPVMVLEDDIILAVSRGIYRGKLEDGRVIQLRKVHSGPRCLLQGWAVDSNGNIFYGEYQRGSHKATQLYMSDDDGLSWKVKKTFPRSEIEHIHCVTVDPHSNLLWIATGDKDTESRILYSGDYGNSLKKFGGGDQNWRTVSIQFTRDLIIWGTDIPERNNYLFVHNRMNGERSIVKSTRNPFYYSAQDGQGNIYFSTGAEDPIYEGEKFSELWRLKGNEEPKRLIRLSRGNLKYSGMIIFAQGESPKGWLAMSPMNLERHLCEAVVFNINK